MTDPSANFDLPLKQLHIEAGARFGAFAGWDMPLTYKPGVLQEHLHTRSKAGLFDITHMRQFEVEGDEAAAFLDRCCPISADDLEVGGAKYTFFLNQQAGLLDDLIVSRLGQKRFLVVANAGRASEDEAHMRGVVADFDCRLELLDRVFLALQGPEAARVATATGLSVDDLTFMTLKETGSGWFISRSGYTGEDGFEISLPLSEAPELANRFLADADVMWIGLAARDSLRLEAGLCLYGQDLDDQTNPLDAGLMWAIPKALREAGDFIGAEALRTIRQQGAKSRRVGLKPEGRQPTRAGTELFDPAGNRIGKVTSGGFGPSVDHPVAMAYVGPQHAAPGTNLVANVRGKEIPATVHPLPFSPHMYKKG